jgi:hypothetical protein
MRSIFAIWSDDGRIDYGTVPPSRLAGARRFGVAMVAVVVAGIGIWNAYSAVVAKPTVGDNSDVRDSAMRDSANRNSTNQDSANRNLADANRDIADVANAAPGRPTPRSVAMKRRAQLRTIGLAPIGASNRSTTAEPGSVAGSAANAAIALVDRAQAAEPSDRGVAKLEENKLDEKSRGAKKKQTRRTSVVQVYELPDGRQVVVRSRTGNDARQADGADFDPSGNNFTTVPRFGRGIHVARPGLFGAPF